MEEYRRLVGEQNRLITKEFVQEQLQIGEDEISELKLELTNSEHRLAGRLRHNELLADHLASLGYGSLETGGSARHAALVRSPQMRKAMLAQRQGASDLVGLTGGAGAGCVGEEARFGSKMIDNIALAIAEIHREVRLKVKPLLEYYRDLFYLQLHFSLILGQVCNYCMPLVTENIGLIDRIFFWSERPEFDLVRRSGDISDRLKEVYTRGQAVLSVLTESVRFLKSKVDLQKSLEARFRERLDEQQQLKDKVLREIHSTKQNMDLLEEENDRLVGSLVKLDPSFVDSRHFAELADGSGLNLNKYRAAGRKASEPRSIHESPKEASSAIVGQTQHNAAASVDNSNSNNNNEQLQQTEADGAISPAVNLHTNNNKATSMSEGVRCRGTKMVTLSPMRGGEEEREEDEATSLLLTTTEKMTDDSSHHGLLSSRMDSVDEEKKEKKEEDRLSELRARDRLGGCLNSEPR
ncbi:unnamed protein product, partial [Protopolystoma xenopodis]